MINGYASAQNCELKAGDELFLLARGASLSPQELRELMLARNAPAVNAALQGSRVAICGLGGLGAQRSTVHGPGGFSWDDAIFVT